MPQKTKRPDWKKGHPWGNHCPDLFKNHHNESIYGYMAESINKRIKHKMGKDERGQHVKPC